MRPVDFIGRVVKADSKEVVSHVEGTIFQYEDKLAGTSGWQGSFLRWKNEAALMAARQASEPVLLACNDGRQRLRIEIVEVLVQDEGDVAALDALGAVRNRDQKKAVVCKRIALRTQEG